jgi:hypothetical protein
MADINDRGDDIIDAAEAERRRRRRQVEDDDVVEDIDDDDDDDDDDAMKALQAKAAALRAADPSLSRERAFAKAYTDPANRDLAAAERRGAMAKLAKSMMRAAR